ncbi:hypothetical protein J2S43_002280 [Catenuloplanes nepalensis]|uniref:Uncharacterized protein n=1 Tax=Catenuloplanes nepalensis TaxID=587533 RepID=A0ABT9MQU0_9ACTN|nr:hypothetical protein [Catenuloplanes nepalensis]MDP9793768.1 hypothetical protein [Catenuloplanes nepalensis]
MSLDDFVAFSAEVTGFTEFELLGTGQAGSYLDTVTEVVGERILADLLGAYRARVTETGDEQARAAQLTGAVLGDPRLGPVARNIIKLWYCGVWFALPSAWTGEFGAAGREGTFTASPQAYTQGLLWFAIGANPPGARAPGYASWASPPRIPELPSSAIPRSLTHTSP